MIDTLKYINLYSKFALRIDFLIFLKQFKKICI